jgi:chemotaxis protein methyltransferase WspC
MNVREVAELLRTRIGVDPLSLGSNLLANIVAKRMRALGLTDLKNYVTRVQDSAEEFTVLIEDVVVPETWFFRGGKVFSFLADHVRQASPSATFRILSAPCSSGEEPYSMAIALVEAGIPSERWTVEGIDVSARGLARARQGVYRESSFRETPDLPRGQYFQERDGGWELDPALRSLVCFQLGNLLDPELLAGAAPFDLIFCRNVLIYLHAEARRRVLANLQRLLAPRGLLCMGHAEPLNLLDPQFQTTGPPAYFLFQRGGKQARNHPAPTGLPPAPPRKQPRFKAPEPRRPRPPSVAAAPSAAVAAPDLLLRARREADAGSLDKALQTCQAHLAIAEPSADAYSLLGIIHQARQERSEAVECFRQALYLDPQHEESLLHLLLLYQENGDEAAALRLRRRLERKAAGGKT